MTAFRIYKKLFGSTWYIYSSDGKTTLSTSADIPVDRLQKAWGLAFRKCPGIKSRFLRKPWGLLAARVIETLNAKAFFTNLLKKQLKNFTWRNGYEFTLNRPPIKQVNNLRLPTNMENNEKSITCHFCFSEFELDLAVSPDFSGQVTEIYDCVVCCNPNKIVYEVSGGDVLTLQVSDGNE